MRATKASWIQRLALLSLLVVAGSVTVSAIGIHPNRIDVVVPYGETNTLHVVVSNPGDSLLQVNVALAGLEMEQDGSLVWLGNDGTDANGDVYPYASIGSCVTFDPATFALEPRSERTLLVHVRAPDAVAEQDMAGRIGALWFDVIDASADSEGTSPFNTVFRMISFVLIRFDGNQHPVAELSPLPVHQDGEMDVHLPFLFSNLGNVHVSPSGQVVLRDAVSGEIVDTLGFSEGTSLPQCPRDYEAVWRKSAIRQGRFIAEFDVAYSAEAPDLSASVLFEINAGKLAQWTEGT